MLRRAIWILALGVVLTTNATARAQSLVVDLQWPYNVPLQYWDNWKGAPDAHAGFGYQPLYLKFPLSGIQNHSPISKSAGIFNTTFSETVTKEPA